MPFHTIEEAIDDIRQGKWSSWSMTKIAKTRGT